MRLHLAGYLNFFDAQKRSFIELEMTGPVSLSFILTELGLPLHEIVLCVVNGKSVDLETAFVTNQDLIELIPPMGGGAF